MKITYMSDLHLEHHRDGGAAFLKELSEKDLTETLVLAGDICTFSMMEQVFGTFCDMYDQVVHICGNHEYYAHSKSAVDSKLEMISTSLDNFRHLNRSSVVIGGQRFIGATLWFPFESMNFSKETMLTDFDRIDDFRKWVYDENLKDVLYLKDNIVEGDIVVTHYLPSIMSVDSMYRTNRLNCFYVCSMEDTIMDNKPAVWLHGHIHGNVDYVLGDTRVLCNPRGYGTENVSFDIRSTFTVK